MEERQYLLITSRNADSSSLPISTSPLPTLLPLTSERINWALSYVDFLVVRDFSN